MKYYLSIYGFMFLTMLGCATPLHTQIHEQIQVGDSADHVKEVLGNPDSFGPSRRIEGATAWYYTSQGTVCGLTINFDKVAFITCDSSNYRSTGQQVLGGVGTIFQGMGQGLQNSSKHAPVQTHCTPDYFGGYNCQSP